MNKTYIIKKQLNGNVYLLCNQSMSRTTHFDERTFFMLHENTNNIVPFNTVLFSDRAAAINKYYRLLQFYNKNRGSGTLSLLVCEEKSKRISEYERYHNKTPEDLASDINEMVTL